MKTKSSVIVAAAVAVTFLATVAMAQTNPPVVIPPLDAPPTFDRPPSGQPVIPERPIVIPPVTPPAPDTPERPEVPGQPAPAADLLQAVKDFQSAREVFMARQKELLAQLKNASTEEREAVRQQLKENLQTWLEEQKSHVQDIREQAGEIRNNVPAINDVVNSGAPEGRGR